MGWKKEQSKKNSMSHVVKRDNSILYLRLFKIKVYFEEGAKKIKLRIRIGELSMLGTSLGEK